MAFAQRQNYLTTHFLERISVVKRRTAVCVCVCVFYSVTYITLCNGFFDSGVLYQNIGLDWNGDFKRLL